MVITPQKMYIDDFTGHIVAASALLSQAPPRPARKHCPRADGAPRDGAPLGLGMLLEACEA